MSRLVKTGNIVSGVGHVGVIGWILFGGLLNPEPEPVEVQEVAMISGAEFDALVDSQQQPQELAPEPEVAAPDPVEDAPEIAVAPEEPVAPEPVPEQPVTPPTQTPETPAEPNVSEAAPELPEPPAEVTVDDAPVDDTPVERPADTVAPDPSPQPQPETPQDIDTQEAVVPDAAGEVEQDSQDSTDTPEASDRIITEAAQPPASAPTTSFRPPARRPTPPAPATVADAPQPDTQEPSSDPVDDAAVQAALEAALSSADADVPTGPPMSSGEKDALRLAVQACWLVDPGASWARTTVTVAMSMTQDGRVVANSIRMIASEGGDAALAETAFQAARRAILLCGREGYPLPPEKYGQWKDIEMTFNPERMRIR
ncbi:energy transducer TonB [Sulfitobacter sp. S190]|uniref:energy transducer TonB n=1 Tax=Sulfitobacter sp. S190 TaxID=2867022 RepID=UPI0021A2EDC3|nr:energy transducer TonB [Sulfitobacter sp. S190]UWR23380.1 energy transducer TonB [Sulfitobacter sp. S190]